MREAKKKNTETHLRIEQRNKGKNKEVPHNLRIEENRKKKRKGENRGSLEQNLPRMEGRKPLECCYVQSSWEPSRTELQCLRSACYKQSCGNLHTNKIEGIEEGL